MNPGLVFTAAITILLVSVMFQSDAKTDKGELVTVKIWSPLKTLCFDDHVTPEFSYHFLYPLRYATEEILLYTEDQWHEVYGSNKDCAERAAEADPHNNQVIALNDSDTLTSRHSGCKLIHRGGSEDYECIGKHTFTTPKSRCWYLALARCIPSPEHVLGLMLTYNLSSNTTNLN